MRVLHIMNELRPSGMETMLRAAASYWRAAGIQAEILCTGEKRGDYAAALQAAGYTIHHLPFQRSAGFLFAVWRFLRRHRYDTVHIHTERAAFWYAALSSLTGQRRIVRSIHGVFAFRGTLRLRRYVQRFLMRRLLGVQTAVCSESVRQTEHQTFCNPTTVISNWFDDAALRPPSASERAEARAALGIDSHVFVFLSVGNCGAVKNHSVILEAIAAVRTAIPLIYLHAGAEEANTPEQALATQLGVAECVRFLGPIPAPGQLLHAADLFVMPSLREGFGIAAIEAMGAGLPVALADVEGLRDFRKLGESIYWIAPTSQGVESAIRHFAALSPLDRQEQGTSLSQAAHGQFGVAVGAAQYAALQRGDLSESAPRPIWRTMKVHDSES